MIGPSRPIEPPLPMESAEASDLMTATIGPNDAVVVIDGVHHFRHAVSLCLRGKLSHQERNSRRPHHRDENHPDSPRTGRGMQVGVVDEREVPQEQEIMEQRNQAAKHHGPEPGNQPDQNRQKVECQQSNRLSASWLFRNHLGATK